MPLKLELLSRENDVLLVSVCVAVKSLPVPLAIKGSESKTDSDHCISKFFN